MYFIDRPMAYGSIFFKKPRKFSDESGTQTRSIQIGDPKLSQHFLLNNKETLAQINKCQNSLRVFFFYVWDQWSNTVFEWRFLNKFLSSFISHGIILWNFLKAFQIS